MDIAVSSTLASLSLLRIEISGAIAHVRLDRPEKRNAVNDVLIAQILLDAQEGQQVGISHYLVAEGEGVAKAMTLAEKIAANAPLSNFAVMHALPRIAELSQSNGLFVESLMAAIAQGDPDAKQRMQAFLEGRAGKLNEVKKVRKP